MAFRESTHRQHWLFGSTERLTKLREDARASSLKRVNLATNNQPPGPLLTIEEEMILHGYYLDRLADMAKSLKKPEKVRATASMYYKRFYLFNTAIDYSPKETMLTCLFLACKSEDMISSMDEFVRPIKKGADKIRVYILKHELVVVEQLRFHLQICHPFHAIEGLCVDAKERGNVFSTNAEVVSRDAISRCLKGLVTDVGLLYPPSHIALACVMAAAEAVGEGPALVKFTQDTLEVPASVMNEMKTIQDMIVVEKVQDDQVKKVDKKLRVFQPHNLEPDSDEYRIKLERRMQGGFETRPTTTEGIEADRTT